MQRRPGEQVAQRADAHIDVAVLQQQLDGDGKRQQRRDLQRDAQQQQRQRAAQGFEHLVQRVLHQPVEAIHPRDAVVHRMQAPQQRRTVAGDVHQGDAEIRDQQRHQQLQRQRPCRRPQVEMRQPEGHQGNRGNAEGVQGFVDQRMDQVAVAIAVALVPAGSIGPQSLGDEGQQDRQRQQRRQGNQRDAFTDQVQGQADEAEEERGGIEVSHGAAPIQEERPVFPQRRPSRLNNPRIRRRHRARFPCLYRPPQRLFEITPTMYWFRSRRSSMLQACGGIFTPFSRRVLGIRLPLGRNTTDDTMTPG